MLQPSVKSSTPPVCTQGRADVSASDCNVSSPDQQSLYEPNPLQQVFLGNLADSPPLQQAVSLQPGNVHENTPINDILPKKPHAMPRGTQYTSPAGTFKKKGMICLILCQIYKRG